MEPKHSKIHINQDNSPKKIEVGKIEHMSIDLDETDNISLNDSKTWNVFGYSIPKQEVMYFSQIIVLYIVIIISIINIILQNGQYNLWLNLLSAAVGYLLPNPSLKKETIIMQRSSGQ